MLDPCPTTHNRWLVEKRDGRWKTFIAEVYADPEHQGGADWQGTKEANARLIASAPELLEALLHHNESPSELPGFCSCPLENGTRPDGEHSSKCQLARAAIAKATGEGA